jgi:glycosyltransferase involved in cell wall biosynthesis
MARGLPVVAPQGTPPAALAGDGACGLHVGDDPAMAASAVARLLGAPARRAALARAAAERAARDHDWTVLLDRVQDALARAAGQPRVRGGEALAVAPAGASPSLHAP